MKNVIVEFYAGVLFYLNYNAPVESLMLLAQKASPSWDANEQSIKFLEACVNRNSSVKDDETWTAMTSDFLRAAFKDLSVLKDSTAMRTFTKLARKVSPTFAHGDDMFVWARSVKERPDGSARIILHVSDIKRFRKEIEEHNFVDTSTNTAGTMEDVILMGS